MHRYLRSIGFSRHTRAEVRELILNSVRTADRRGNTFAADQSYLAEFSREYASGMGITVSGTFDDDDKFHLDYYYPYFEGTGITTTEDVTVERHAADDSYAGSCEDLRVGISLIFYLQNRIPYVKAQTLGRLPIQGTTVTLSALSVQGTVLFPIRKNEDEIQREREQIAERTKLLYKAKGGDENAIETLTLEDMDLYRSISKKILNEDLYSIVDTTFMPYGFECDQYMILGEIMDVRTVVNHISEEQIYVLTVCCNDLTFDVAINIMDLLGEPKVGRRFKGAIWLQGKINYPDEI